MDRAGDGSLMFRADRQVLIFPNVKLAAFTEWQEILRAFDGFL
jgi:hypothetical protein